MEYETKCGKFEVSYKDGETYSLVTGGISDKLRDLMYRNVFEINTIEQLLLLREKWGEQDGYIYNLVYEVNGMACDEDCEVKDAARKVLGMYINSGGEIHQRDSEEDIGDDYIKVKHAERPYNYIYFLLDRGVVVYVGQSRVSANKRIIAHRADGKIFDSHMVMRVDASLDLNLVEAGYIYRLNPKYNHNMPDNGHYFNEEQVSKRLEEVMHRLNPQLKIKKSEILDYLSDIYPHLERRKFYDLFAIQSIQDMLIKTFNGDNYKELSITHYTKKDRGECNND